MASVKGTIKRLVSDKGFGFVAAQDGTEYFFHQSACTGVRFDELREGQSVSFEIETISATHMVQFIETGQRLACERN